jgi:hypothetical protein
MDGIDIEAVALETVAAGLGVVVEAWDVPPRQAACDGRFEVGERVGFVEVTTFTSEARESGRQAYRDLRRWEGIGGLGHTYTVNVDAAVDSREFRRRMPELLRSFEAIDPRTESDFLDHLEQAEPELARWAVPLMEDRRLYFQRITTSAPVGTVFVMPSTSHGGWQHDDPNGLLDAVSVTLASPAVAKRVQKLKNGGDVEQHLFVRVDAWEWEWNAANVLLSIDERVPDNPPEVPGHLDGLWLWCTMNRSCIRWLRSDGWAWLPIPPIEGLEWR